MYCEEWSGGQDPEHVPNQGWESPGQFQKPLTSCLCLAGGREPFFLILIENEKFNECFVYIIRGSIPALHLC